MYQIYAIIGTFLSVAAIIYAYYFFHYLKGNTDKFSINAFSDTILTFFIGLFYVYSAVILSQPGPLNSDSDLHNFTNNIGDILTVSIINPTEMNIHTDNIELVVKTTTENFVNVEMFYSTTETDENMLESTTSNGNLGNPENMQEEVTTTSDEIVTLKETDKSDQFLSKYQNFIKQFIKQKFNNSSVNNSKEGNLNKSQITRTKREINNNNNTENSENCFNQTFYGDALLISSFIHCLINLLKQTLYCKTCVNNAEDQNNRKDSDKIEEEHKKENSIDNEENVNSAEVTQVTVLSDSLSGIEKENSPIGPLFSERQRSEFDSGLSTNLEIFQAKCRSESNVFKNEISNGKIPTDEKYQSILEILISWILPVLATLILYFLMNQQMSAQYQDILPITFPNLNSTRVNPNISYIMQHPNSSVLDKIISNVYHVVDQVKRNTSAKVTPSTLDILHSMQHQNRIPKEKQFNMCPKITTLGMKLYYFFIYLAILLGILFYGKIIQTIAKTKNSEYSKQLNNSLLAFSAMWLPSITDVLLRTFFNSNKITILSDLFLLLGNSNQLYTMASNYYQCKNNNKCNVVEPEP